MNDTQRPPLPPEEIQAAIAAVDLIGRAGAKAVEYGYANDNAVRIEDADWYASAHYRGTRIQEEHHPSPGTALEALATKILTGAQCQHCKGLVTLREDGAAMAWIDQPLMDGTVMTMERALSMPHCRWRRVGDRWIRGCEVVRRRPKQHTGKRGKGKAASKGKKRR